MIYITLGRNKNYNISTDTMMFHSHSHQSLMPTNPHSLEGFLAPLTVLSINATKQNITMVFNWNKIFDEKVDSVNFMDILVANTCEQFYQLRFVDI